MINEQNANAYCIEDISLIENYQSAINDKTQIWICHHRREIQDGIKISSTELIKQGLYYHRPANELIFLTKQEHTSIHHKGKHLSDDLKTQIANKLKGHETWNKGKTLSDETKQKISKSCKGKCVGESNGFYNKRHNEETIMRIKASLKKYWAIRKSIQNSTNSY